MSLLACHFVRARHTLNRPKKKVRSVLCVNGADSSMKDNRRVGSSELPSMFASVATAHTGAHSTSNASSLVDSIATQLALLNHPHMAAFILILLDTYMRPSERLAWREKILSHRLRHFSRVGRS